MKSIHTKRILADSLKILLKEKSIQKIKVKDITDKCMMSRKSFYYHFKDTRDLIEWIFEEEILPYLKIKSGKSLWEEGILDLLHYMDKNKHIFINGEINLLSTPTGKNFFLAYYDISYKTLNEINVGDMISEREKQHMAEYYVISLFSYIEAWIRGVVDSTPEEISELISEILTDHITGKVYRLAPDLLR